MCFLIKWDSTSSGFTNPINQDHAKRSQEADYQLGASGHQPVQKQYEAKAAEE